VKTYSVELTERAEIDVDGIYLGYNWITPNQAERWRVGFAKSLASLSSLPNRCAVARDDARYQGITVRQLLFGKYRILFHVVEPAEGETEGSVRVIRVIHGARATEPEEEDA